MCKRYPASQGTTMERKKDTDDNVERFSIEFPKLPLSFVGSGDLFTAVFTAWLTRSGGDSWPDSMDLPLALEKTVATMQSVLNRTLNHYNKCVASSSGKMPKPALKELKLIQSRDDILDPKIFHRANRVAM